MAPKNLDRFIWWLQDNEYSENTIESYRYAIWEYQTRYHAITKENLFQWKSWLASCHSVQTANLRIAAMNQYLKFTKISINPVKRIKTQKAISVENVISQEDYSRLINGLMADGEYRWTVYYQILAKTGARISEALKLKVSDLDRGFAILKTKGKVRRIWLPKALILDTKKLYENTDPESLLILNRYGKPMTSRGFSAAMQAHADRYGIPKERMHPHALRHFFALQFLKNNQDITLLADLLGHSNLNTTMIYARKSAEEQQQILNQTVNW